MTARTHRSRPRNAKVTTGKGKRQAKRLGDRLNRHQISLRSRIDHQTISKYLAMQGAPKPDKDMRFSYREVIEFIDANSTRATTNTEELRKLKQSLLQLQSEEAAFDFGVKRGRYVEREKLEPAIAAFCAQLTADLRAKFEFELPPKYAGKPAVDCRQMNAEAVDWVLTRLRDGTGKVGAP